MSETVNVHEAKTHLSRLLDRAHAGEEIVLAKSGKPYARLMPLAAAAGQRRPGRLAGRLDEAFFEPLPEEELALWEGSTPDPLTQPEPAEPAEPATRPNKRAASRPRRR